MRKKSSASFVTPAGFARGVKVESVAGPGVLFWIGADKRNPGGTRVGVKLDAHGATVFLDAGEVSVATAEPSITVLPRIAREEEEGPGVVFARAQSAQDDERAERAAIQAEAPLTPRSAVHVAPAPPARVVPVPTPAKPTAGPSVAAVKAGPMTGALAWCAQVAERAEAG